MKNVIVVILAIIVAISAIAVVAAVNVLKGVEYTTVETPNGETVVMIRPLVISKDKKTVSYKPVDEEIEVQFSYDSVVEINTAWN